MTNRCARCQRPVRYKYCPACCKVLGINYNDQWRRRSKICNTCKISFKYSINKAKEFVCPDCRLKKRLRLKAKIGGILWKEFYRIFEEGKRKKGLEKIIEQMDEMLMQK